MITCSIVLFHNKEDDMMNAIKSFLDTSLPIQLFLVDNSATDSLKFLSEINSRITYIFNNKNIGFGAAHNIAIKKSIARGADYHLVLNPDVYFNGSILQDIVSFMNIHPNVGNLMPLVQYPDGRIQKLCKLLPTPVDLIFRRFIPIESLQKSINHRYELHDFDYQSILNVPNLSGCFMFLRVEAIKQIGMFDENIFMYLEDIDLNRRIHACYETIFYPRVTINHVFEKASYKNRTLLKYHIKAAIYYFNKWGWFFDKRRQEINNRLLQMLK